MAKTRTQRDHDDERDDQERAPQETPAPVAEPPAEPAERRDPIDPADGSYRS